MKDKWDIYFLDLAKRTALQSKDRSTKLGAVVVGPDREVRATGYNGFPRGIDDEAPERHERPLKYRFTEHAERNAVFNAARVGVSLKGCVLYCAWPPCCDCARAIIQAGIVEVVVESMTVPDRWAEDMTHARVMLSEAGVRIREAR